MDKVFKDIQDIAITPVVVLHKVSDVDPLISALLEGGLPCAEVTFRSDVAEDSIKLISKKYPNVLLGAGTVLTIDQADRAMDSGATFLVCPGLNPKLVEYCLKKNYPICPGVMTPSELDLAVSFGLDAVKFFPSEQVGGVSMIKAISAPYPDVRFMPTGGINASNVGKYLAFEKVFACGGSWMVKSNLVDDGKFDEIVRLTKEAVDIIREVRKE